MKTVNRKLHIGVLVSILLPAAAWAAAGDFNGDGEVYVADVLLLAADWLAEDEAIATAACDMDDSNSVNLADFALFATAWRQGYVNQAPTAQAVNADVTAGEYVALTLVGADEDSPTLQYRWVTHPSKGRLDPTADGATWWYTARWDTSGQDVFSYRVFDGFKYSEPAEVNVVITEATLDNLSFVRPASVVIDDGDTVNVDDSFTVCFWFKTFWPYGALFSKRAAGGDGIEISIEGGRAVARLYDEGTHYTLRTDTRVNDGVWRFCALSYKTGGGLESGADLAKGLSGLLMVAREEQFESETAFAVVPACDFSNDANVVFGCIGDMLYYGSIDSFSNYATGQGEFALATILIEGRTVMPHGLSPTFARRFLLNEGMGTTIRDTTETREGTLQDGGRVLWTPPNYPPDRSFDRRSRTRTIEGIEMLPDFRRRN
ncbi:MAG: Ig-like domain-containing protein [Planctomycetaceae bacterium]|nr:Ig-like domain-containing protein [Planctomycetaceae bacterium]